MTESPTVDEFIRHMQAELDACEDIVDKNERQKRQWQIESTLLQAIEFSNRFKELSKLGQNPMKIVEALSNPNTDSAEIAKQVIAIAGGICPHCGAGIDADLDFCSACGNYIE
jgi:hypothetical protein